MKKILVIQTAFIGDVILATSVIETLHEQFPDASIDFLVRKGNESLLENHPFIQQVLVWDKRNGKWRSMWRIIKHIRSTSYDAIFNLQRFASSGLMTAFSGAKIKSGFEKNPLSFAFTHKAQHKINENASPDILVHEIDRNYGVIAPFVKVSCLKPKLYPSSRDFEHIRKYQESDYITISPASVWETKKTPLNKWKELIEKSNAKKIFILGGPGDTIVCNELMSAENSTRVEVLAGKLSLLQSAALMQGAQMNFVNDSGPLHLCSATNAPVTAVFCSTLPAFGFTPLSDQSIVVETREQLDCRPCGLHGHKSCPQGHFKCGHSITIDQLTNDEA